MYLSFLEFFSMATTNTSFLCDYFAWEICGFQTQIFYYSVRAHFLLHLEKYDSAWQPFKLHSVFEFLNRSSQSCAVDVTVGAQTPWKHLTSLCGHVSVSHTHLVTISFLYFETLLWASYEKGSPQLLSLVRHSGFGGLDNSRKVDRFSNLNSNIDY